MKLRSDMSQFIVRALLLTPVICCSRSFAQGANGFTWNPVHLGAGGFVTGMAVSPTDPSAIYARTDVGNAYRYDGDHWTPIRVYNQGSSNGIQSPTDTAAPEYLGVNSIAVDPSRSQNVYMAFPAMHSADSGVPSKGVNVFRSTDFGNTFFPGDLNVPGDPNNNDYRTLGERLMVDPVNSAVLYYGSNSGIYVSTNGAVNWSPAAGTNAPGGNVINILFDRTGGTTNLQGVPNPVTSNIYAVVYNGDIYRSTNGGAEWTNISSTVDLSGHAAYTTVDNGGRLYATAAFDNNNQSSTRPQFYWLYNNGAWNSVNINSTALQNVAPDPNNDPNDLTTARLYAIDTGGVTYRSNDGGANWTNLGRLQYASSQFGWLPQQYPNNSYRSNAGIRFDANGTNLWVAQGNEGALRYTPPARGFDTSTASPQWTITSRGIEEFVASAIVVPPGSGENVTYGVLDAGALVSNNPDNFGTVRQVPLQQFIISEGAGLAYSPDATNYVVISNSDEYTQLPNWSGYSNDYGNTWLPFGSAVQFQNSSGNFDAPAGSIAVSARGGVIAAGSDHIVITPVYNALPEWSNDGGATFHETGSFPGGSAHTLPSPLQTVPNPGTHSQQLVADTVQPDLFFLKFLQGPSDGTNFFISRNGGQDWTGYDAGLPNRTFHGQLVTNHNVPDDLWFVDGWEGAGDSGTSGGAHGVWHRSPDPNNPTTYRFSRLGNVDNAVQIALGAQTPGSSVRYTVYIYGKITGDAAWGVFRSTNAGGTWDRIAYYPAGIFDWPTTMAASWDIVGRVYIGFDGNSFVYSQGPAQ